MVNFIEHVQFRYILGGPKNAIAVFETAIRVKSWIYHQIVMVKPKRRRIYGNQTTVNINIPLMDGVVVVMEFPTC